MEEKHDHGREEAPDRPSDSRENTRRQAEEERDPNIRAEDYGEPPPRPSWWRWIFGGGG